MSAASIAIRLGEAQDVNFLRDLVRHTGLGRSGTVDAAPPPLARYVAGWGRAGDTSVVALDEQTHVPVGAAWYRLFTAGQAGFGFIDEKTPELTVAVVPNRRGAGIGRQLLEAIVERARHDGFSALSLSAPSDSQMTSLAESLGFTVVDRRGPAVTMTLRLL
jgi:GNAT superfamily N-acetyltransferase